MLIRILTIILTVFFLAGGRAEAQIAGPLDVVTEESAKPAVTPPERVAMLFYLLTGKTPDFKFWAHETPEYKNAAPVEKMLVEKQQTERMKNNYTLLTREDQVIVEMPAMVSAYSEVGRGFFIENFKEDLFFPVIFTGENYALVPQAIMDHQWVPAEGRQKMRDIETAAAGGKDRRLPLILYLKPRSADGTSPATIEDTPFWLMSVEVKKMELYTPDGAQLLWSSDEGKEKTNAQQQELLNLYH